MGYTITLFLITIVISIPLGLAATFLSRSRFAPVRAVTRAYVFVMRGSPLMLQLFFFYFGLPFLPFVGRFLIMDRFTAGCVAFALNYAAYFCEIYRSGIESMPVGQYEAADVLGYTRSQTFLKIIFPQVFKRILPAVTNEVITLVKDTSLASAIGTVEMFTKAKQIAVSPRSPGMLTFLVAGVFYFVFNAIVAFVMKRIEKALSYYD